MKFNYSITCLLAALFSSFFALKTSAQIAPDFVWAKQTTGAGIAYGFSTATDNDGNVYVAGEFTGSAFDPITFPNPPPGERMFLAKYEPSGNILWVKMISGIKGESDGGSFKIAVNGIGDVFVAAGFDNTVYFDGFTLNGSSSTQAAFVAKFDTNGYFIWAKEAYSYANVYNSKIIADNIGNSYLLGTKLGNSSITVHTTTFPGNDSQRFMAKFDPAGNVLWAKSLGYSINDGKAYFLDLDLSPQGDIVLAGKLEDSVIFGTDTLSNPGNHFLLIAKYDNDGNFLWATNHSGPLANAVEVDGNGNIYVACPFANSVTVGNIPFTSLGGQDICLASFTASGSFRWAKHEGGPSFDFDASLAVTSSGQSYLLRSFTDSTLFNSVYFPAEGDTDALVSCYDEAGVPLWALPISGSGNIRSMANAVDGNDCVVTGFFSGNAQFGNHQLNAPTGNPFSAGRLFVARIGTVNAFSDDTDNHDLLTAFPNPAENVVTLTYSLPPGTQSASIQLSEIATGRKMQTVQLNTNSSEAKVNLQIVPSGMYSYTLVVNGAPVATKKLAVVK